MDPISMVAGAAGALPMITGIVDKGLDAVNGALDLANKALGEGSKICGEEQAPQGQIDFS